MRNSRIPLCACLCWALTALALLSPALRAEQTETFEPPNSHISIKTSRLSDMSNHGFYPVKVTLTNNGPKDSEWEFSFDRNYLSSLKVPPGQTVTTVVYVPHVKGISSPMFNMSERNGKHANSIYFNRSYDHERRYAGASPRLDPAINTSIDSSNRVSAISTISPNEWPADERIYSSLAYMIFDKKDYDDLDSSRKKAIRQWVASGGNLFVINIDKGGPQSKVDSEEAIGWGSIKHLSASNAKHAADFTGEQLQNTSPGIMDYPDFPGSIKQYQLNSPAMALIILLLVFAVIIGPVCLFVWAPAKKRQRLFILVPAISFGFSVVLMLLILLIDGTGGQGMRVASVYLNPETNTATVKQHQICKTGLLMNNSFTLDDRAEFYSEFEDSKREGPQNRALNQFTGDWFGSRSQIDQKLMLNVPTRARVSVVAEEGGRPVVQSTVPGSLKQFVYQDADGVYWTTDALPPGQKTTLTRMTGKAPSNLKVLKGNFTAIGEACELAPVDTLSSINWDKDYVSFFGPVTHE